MGVFADPIAALMDDGGVTVTTDPAGEIRLFVYSAAGSAFSEAVVAAGGGTGAVVRHTVSGETRT